MLSYLSLRLLAASIPLSVLVTLVSAQCYYPNGALSPDVPCDSSASVSSCCGPDGSWCMANSLCLANGVLSRGSCTDKGWGDGCTGYCATTDPSGGAALIVCDVQNNIYTCGINSTSCLDSSSTFVMTDAVDLLLRPTMVAKLEGATSSAMTIAPTDTLTVASASSTSGSTNADAATVTITATATANSSDSPSKSLGNDQYSVGAVAGAAVGVGIPLLIALVGAILVILNQRKQLRRTGGEAYSDNAKPHGYSPPSGYVPVSPSKHQRGMSNGGYVESKPSAAAYYAPAPQHSPPLHSMTSTVPPQAGHFREMVPTVGMGEMDTERERQELDGGMANAVSRTQTEE